MFFTEYSLSFNSINVYQQIYACKIGGVFNTLALNWIELRNDVLDPRNSLKILPWFNGIHAWSNHYFLKSKYHFILLLLFYAVSISDEEFCARVTSGCRLNCFAAVSRDLNSASEYMSAKLTARSMNKNSLQFFRIQAEKEPTAMHCIHDDWRGEMHFKVVQYAEC